jgi:hypothetical protein
VDMATVLGSGALRGEGGPGGSGGRDDLGRAERPPGPRTGGRDHVSVVEGAVPGQQDGHASTVPEREVACQPSTRSLARRRAMSAAVTPASSR